jgi:hypothetical protein
VACVQPACGAAARRAGYDARAEAAGDLDRVVGRSAVADDDGKTRQRCERALEAGRGIQGGDDDVEIDRHWLQDAPPRTQNLAQCG